MHVKINERLKFELDAINNEHGPEIVLDILTTCITSTLLLGWVASKHEDLIEAVAEDIREKLHILYNSEDRQDEIN